jgi:multiple sugar transport system substrate-binding protein
MLTTSVILSARSARRIAAPGARRSIPARDSDPSRAPRAQDDVRARRLLAGGALLLAAACGRAEGREPTTIRLWAFGREGEVVQQLVPEFERRNPGVRVRVQQIPWSAAHEKLLTAFVGEATPDVSQLGNTWVPEFQALGALEPLDARVAASAAVERAAYFPGVWATNVVDDTTFGVPWYVDTRVLFYRTDLLRRAGYDAPPTSWAAWVEAMRKVKALGPPVEYAALLPLDEWATPVILGMQNGATLLDGAGRHGAFRDPRFREALRFYVDLFRAGLAPAVANTQISNVFQEFARGRFAFYITGPWNIAEFRNRLPPESQDDWMTAPLPGPRGPGTSSAGGASLVVFRASANKDAAWKLVEFLSAPATQARFYALSGNLPPRTDTWRDSSLANDPHARAFREQLARTAPLPPVPEAELIVQRVAQYAEQAARGRMTVDAALAALDGEVDRILEKRRWVLDRRAERVGARE